MSAVRIAAVLALLALLPTPAFASEDLKAVPARLDPASAYVLVDVVNDPPQKLQAQIILARYDRDRRDVRGLGRAAANPVPAGEDAQAMTKVGRSLSGKKNGGLHLLRLTPGIWTIEGVGGTSESLGSYSFELPAGQVTDLGVIAVRYTDYEGKPVNTMSTGRLLKTVLMAHALKTPKLNMAASVRARTPDDPPLPATIAALHAAPVELVPGAQFGNHLGGLIDRLDRPPPPSQ
jgi:hypothetical protein